MIFRLATMTVWDQYHVYRLYREFLISEPCSVLLNLKDCHLETRPAIMASLTNLIMNGNIMLCVDYVDDFWEALGNTNQPDLQHNIGTFRGMGVFYPQACDPPDDDANARALMAGYPELGPVMEVATLALDMRALGELLGAEHFTLIEILVTTARCRGRGVGAGMVTEIMSKCER